ncbi:unnamed protein product [Clavelina lepadiformis]|uniref:Selenoprotein O n=1 Tax=Clavelina lepadiformis TaxID=159417 RepID=A0ABP0GAY9_CLALP
MASASYKQLKNLKFENLVLKALPIDKTMRPGSRKVPGACFSLVKPTPVENPKLVVMSQSAMKLLDIDENSGTTQEFEEYFSGNKTLPGSETAAHCYCGHQFGSFSGQLGDGAAIYLGEIANSRGENWEFQLKGAGPTPYSRSSDGRKVLRSSIREFLCSEAMQHLGIPTTRAGTLVTSDSLITRDMFYDGWPRREKCSLVLRIAPTFLRFGSFEICKPMDLMTGREGPSVGKIEILRQLLDYSIKTFYRQIMEIQSKETQYLKFYEEVCVRTARLVAQWQCVGFCHGVLNTDNMSILGLTIDYGPFGFMDRYDPDFVCNSSDQNGRYTYKKQPEICHWNLKKFAEALKELVPLDRSLQVLGDVYYREFNSTYLSKMRKKFGLKRKEEEDDELIRDFLQTMQETFADFTNSFRNLSSLSLPGCSDYDETKEKFLDASLANCASLEVAKVALKPQFDPQQLDALKKMVAENPRFLDVIGGADGPIKKEIEKVEKYQKLEEIDENELKSLNRAKWISWLDKYEARLHKECGDIDDVSMHDVIRRKEMNLNNPKYILRNYIAQNAIEESERGNHLEVQNVLRRLEHPYDETASPLFGFQNILYNALPPLDKIDLRVS